mmetsp:Transcript_54247/g.166913  ORF Transcript_54247/g.166913 Transcript_54247/m.166913 type:complete len:347 (-) Transcript_54247:417-1457(-)
MVKCSAQKRRRARLGHERKANSMCTKSKERGMKGDLRKKRSPPSVMAVVRCPCAHTCGVRQKGLDLHWVAAVARCDHGGQGGKRPAKRRSVAKPPLGRGVVGQIAHAHRHRRGHERPTQDILDSTGDARPRRLGLVVRTAAAPAARLSLTLLLLAVGVVVAAQDVHPFALRVVHLARELDHADRAGAVVGASVPSSGDVVVGNDLLDAGGQARPAARRLVEAGRRGRRGRQREGGGRLGRLRHAEAELVSAVGPVGHAERGNEARAARVARARVHLALGEHGPRLLRGAEEGVERGVPARREREPLAVRLLAREQHLHLAGEGGTGDAEDVGGSLAHRGAEAPEEP